MKYKCLKPKLQNAYTLAEVLIVLGIVGITAAMAIPSLYNHFKKVELHARFNKTYSVLHQALELTLGEVGLSSPNDVAIYYDTDKNKIQKRFETFNKIWESKFTAVTKVKASTYSFKGVFKDFWGSPSRIYGDTHTYYYLLQDGAVISDVGYSTRYGNVVALDIFFDTNGLHKGPNRLGYDQFYFYNEGKTSIAQGDVDYMVACDPFLTGSPNGYWDKFKMASCSGYALKNINPFDSSKKYWESLYKSKTWWEELKNSK